MNKQQREQSLRARHQPRDELGRFDTWGGKSPPAQTGRTLANSAPRCSEPSMPAAAVSARMRTPVTKFCESSSEIISGGPTGSMRVVYVGKVRCEIPIDADGFVPREYLIQRYFDVENGISKKGRLRFRKPEVDSKKDAKRIFAGKKFTPDEIAPWVAHPNRFDIEGIDTAGSPGTVYEYWPKRKEDITVYNAYGNQKDLVTKRMNSAFTPSEIRKLSIKQKLLIFIGRPESFARGMYNSGDNAIYVDPKTLDSESTIIHETTHAARYNDGDRTGEVTKTRIRDDGDITEEDATLEEAATQAETMTRMDPFMPKNAGYYGRLTADPEKKIILATKDRLTFTGSTEKNLRGKAAIKSVEDNFGRSEIGNLKLYSSKMTAKEYAAALKGKK